MASAVAKTTQRPMYWSAFHESQARNRKSFPGGSNMSSVIKPSLENRLHDTVEALRSGSTAESIRICSYVLRSVAFQRDLFLAKEIYGRLIGLGLHKNSYIGNIIAFMFLKGGSLEDALQVFEHITEKNLRVLSMIVNKLCSEFCFDEALRLFGFCTHKGLMADGFVICGVLRACGGLRSLRLGREVHAFIYRSGYQDDLYVGNCLINMYGNCNCVADAREVLQRMPRKDIISWNSMLNWFSKAKDYNGFVSLVSEIELKRVEPNLISWNTMISGYACFGLPKDALNCFLKMQSFGIKPDVISCNSLISALAENRFIEEGLELVRQMQAEGLEPDVVSWTALINGYVRLGYFHEGLNLFLKLNVSEVILDQRIFCVIIKACTCLEAYKQGAEIHGYLIRKGFYGKEVTWASLVDMYAKAGKLNYAEKLLSEANFVAWSSLLSVYVKHGNVNRAKKLLKIWK